MARYGTYVVAAFVTLLLAAALWLSESRAAHDQALLSRVPLQLADVPADLHSREFLQQLQNAIVRSPLDPELFGLFFLHQATSGRFPDATVAASARMLGSLGYRSTPVQRLLVDWAEKRGDYSLVIDRTDALLRRNVFRMQGLYVLWQIELSERLRPLLIPSLKAKSDWRGTFLNDPIILAEQDQLQARVGTLNLLLNQGADIEYGDMRNVLNKLIDGEQTESAYALWSRYVGRPREKGVFDPHFVKAEKIQSEGITRSLPFEWSVSSEAGQSVEFANGARIMWEGRGAPLFLSQRLWLEPASYDIEIKVEGAAEVADALRFRLACPGAAALFVAVSQRNGVATLRTDRPTNCPYPRLDVRAGPNFSERSFDMKIMEINLKPAPAGI